MRCRPRTRGWLGACSRPGPRPPASATSRNPAHPDRSAPHLEDFVGRPLRYRPGDSARWRRAITSWRRSSACKRLFVQRRALKAHKPEAAAGFDGEALRRELERPLGEPLTELAFARHVDGLDGGRAANEADLDLAARYAAWAPVTEAGRARHGAGVLFKAPHKIDPQHLVPVEPSSATASPMFELDAASPSAAARASR